MTKKQTQCPECSTIYKVSVAQLSIAQGMVCCPKCFHNFNALLYLVEVNTPQNLPESVTAALLHHDYEHEVSDHVLARSYSQQHILDIFDRKIEHSNIDLHTYLNNLNYFSSDPIHQFPSLKLSEKEIRVPEKHSTKYYIIWSAINLSLMAFLAFQVLWFNPDLVARYPSLNSGFNAICQVISCQTLEQRYKKIQIQQLSIQATQPSATQLSGSLIHNETKSIPMPRIVLYVQTDTTTHNYIFTAAEYLQENYQGIARLPSKTPFKFSFEVPIAKNQIQSSHLEIIQP